MDCALTRTTQHTMIMTQLTMLWMQAAQRRQHSAAQRQLRCPQEQCPPTSRPWRETSRSACPSSWQNWHKVRVLQGAMFRAPKGTAEDSDQIDAGTECKGQCPPPPPPPLPLTSRPCGKISRQRLSQFMAELTQGASALSPMRGPRRQNAIATNEIERGTEGLHAKLMRKAAAAVCTL